MISRSRDMLLTLEYTETKFILGETFVGKFNSYKEMLAETVGLDNKILRQEKTKATALEEMNGVLEAQDQAFASIKAFFSKEPREGAYNGCVTMFGDNFNNGVTLADLNALVVEVGDQVEVMLDALDDGFGEIRLSREKARKQETWDNLERAHSDGVYVVGKVVNKFKCVTQKVKVPF